MLRAVPTLLVLAALVAAGCRAAGSGPRTSPPDDRPYVLVLGTAQDGGYPQIACDAPLCRAAREDPARRRLVTSLLLVDPRDGRRWLFDASPDLPEQVELARGHADPRGGRGGGGPGRPPLFDGIFLTHAHIGHYTGLAQLGREAYGTATTPTYATAAMGDYLAGNGPWSLLVDAGHLELRPLVPGEPVALAADLTVTPLAVPHRPEFSDTVAFVIRGPDRALLYLPDIDKWERWERPIEDELAEVDVALLDASFFDGDELPDRDMAAIPHPFVVESLARFAPLPAAERAKLRFTHLNHSNPLVDPASAATARVRATGCAVAREGDVFRL